MAVAAVQRAAKVVAVGARAAAVEGEEAGRDAPQASRRADVRDAPPVHASGVDGLGRPASGGELGDVAPNRRPRQADAVCDGILANRRS